MPDAASIDLPAWAVVSPRRRTHIARVAALLDSWAEVISLDAAERTAWRDAARYHDALRDAPEDALRRLSGDEASPAPLLHGPAAAARIAADGESRPDVLEAVRWHTLGCAAWARTGRALYMADFLEPGRRFDRELRAAIADEVPHDFDRALRRVVRARIEWALREGKGIHAETARLWDAVR